MCVLQLGAVPEKTVLGVPLYGRAFLLKNTHNDKMGAPAQANSFAGLASIDRILMYLYLLSTTLILTLYVTL